MGRHGSSMGRRGSSMVARQTVVLKSRVQIWRLPSPQLSANLLVGCHLGWHMSAGWPLWGATEEKITKKEPLVHQKHTKKKKSYLWHINFVHVNFVHINFVMYNICTYVHVNIYKNEPPRERIWRKENKQADRFIPICVHIVRIWLVSLRTTCRLGFCQVYTFNDLKELYHILHTVQYICTHE